MADTAVHMFLDNLAQLLESDYDWILPVKDLLQWLHNDIAGMSKYLKETEDKRLDNPKVNNLVMEIRDVAVEAENIVDSFVVDAMTTVGVAHDLSAQLESVRKEMESLKAEMNDTSEIVRLDQQVDHIIQSFDDGKQLETVSIVGFPGIGKTTLAREIHNDIRIKERFPIRAWVAVSQKYDRRGLLVDILKSASLFEDKDTNLDDEQLAQQLLKRLKVERYLIVMDDIWSIEAWDNVKRSLPALHNGSKVMFTSRKAQVGKAAAKHHSVECNTHYVYGLSDEKSWELFQSKVFRNQQAFFSSDDLEEIGRRIVKKCAGVPFSIVLVGGFLSKEKNRPEIWNQVAESLNSSVSSIEEAYMSTMELSYRDLPFHLKACVLYLGMFPEDYEIHARGIIWLIIAEGFVVQDRSDHQVMKNLEDIAQGYLDELAERSLLIVARKRWDGSAKSFHIHDLLRDFCRVKGRRENFISQIFDEHQFSPSAVDISRRLFMSDHAYQKASLQPHARRLRSLVCFGSNSDTDAASNRQVVLNESDYKYLKVLDLLSFRIPFPDDIGNLIHLKYLALSIASDDNGIPESISKLFNLETLILLGTLDSTSLLPLGFWKMSNLRHLYSKSLIFHLFPGSNSILVNLQTLHQLCPCHSCVKMLERTPGIKKLGMRGNLISPSGGVSIPDFSCLKQLHSLKIVNTSGCPPTSSNLVNLSTLPASLTSLTLRNTFLKWEEIFVLGNLGNLEVLKLLDDACVVSDETSDEEPDWDTSDQDFSGLKYLKMKRLDIAKWDDSIVSGFQSLEVLVLEECPRLEMLPLDLALISSLRRIEVTKCKPDLGSRAKEIQRLHEKESGDENLSVEIVS